MSSFKRRKLEVQGNGSIKNFFSGETEHNKLGIIQGQQDTLLSDKGRKQAELVAERLKNDKFSHVFTSDLQRAWESCNIILEANTVTSVNLVKDVRLRERKLGELEGRPISECHDKMNSKESAATGMESKAQLRARAVAFFQSLCKDMWAYLNAQQPVSPPANHPPPANHNNSSSDETDAPMDTQPITTATVSKGAGATKKRKHEHRVDAANNSDSSLDSRLSKPSDDCHNCVATSPGACTPTSPCSLGEGTRACWTRTGRAPNVSISPTGRHRLGRHPAPDPSRNPTPSPSGVSVLIVSHGGLIAELIGHFVEELSCRLPCGSGKRAAQHITPNAAISQFIVQERRGGGSGSNSQEGAQHKPKLICVTLHDKAHLMVNGSSGEAAAPLPTGCYDAL